MEEKETEPTMGHSYNISSVGDFIKFIQLPKNSDVKTRKPRPREVKRVLKVVQLLRIWNKTQPDT